MKLDSKVPGEDDSIHLELYFKIQICILNLNFEFEQQILLFNGSSKYKIKWMKISNYLVELLG